MGIRILLLYILTALVPCFAGDTVHHDLKVKLSPAEHTIKARDTFVLPDGYDAREGIRFLLHGDLDAMLITSGFTLVKNEKVVDHKHFGINSISSVRLNEYVIRCEEEWPEKLEFTIAYKGVIHHPVKSESEEYARSFSQSPGIISEEGTVISGSSFWYPYFGSHLVTFRLEVDLPAGRKAVSQGDRLEHYDTHVVWNSPEPMDDIYLIEATFVEYAETTGEVEAIAYLRTPDTALANKYLEATSRYITMYNELIGPYPYKKFALIENFWETGYGMPSFTLLGPKVIRFPFIIDTSYPHEILHNWWGNSVFVSYETGNWCEGLTAYLADHLLKELKGQGWEYRRDTLKRYVSYVKSAKDFPLREFRSRHDAATEAIGYGKSLMLYHMLRRQLGEETFVKGLREFYRSYRFKVATFEDLESTFSRVSGEDLKLFFRQWVDRTGAPDLRIVRHDYDFKRASGARLKLKLRQVQEGEPFALRVPLAVHFQGGKTATLFFVDMKDREVTFALECPQAISRIEIDPYFDLFRRLDREETPPTIGQAFGAEKLTIILPEKDKLGWKELADSWSSGRDAEFTVVKDSEIDSIPAGQSVWVLGLNNKWRPKADSYSVDDDSFTISGETTPNKDHSFVTTIRNPEDPDQVVCWLAADLASSIPGLSRKLPHYGKYSYLAFKGDEPTNFMKGQWPLDKSPMVLTLEPGEASKLPKRTALAEPPALVDEKRLKAHVTFLVDDRLQGRGLGTEGLDEAADYIADRFKEYGLKPGGKQGSYFQIWNDHAGADDHECEVKNVLGVIPGKNPDVTIVVGAHYDHLGLGWPDVHKGDEGKIHNGADDNASGIAVLLELARLLRDSAPANNILFAAFTGEEAGLKGSRHFVKENTSGEIRAMVNLDTVGRLGERKLMVFGTDSAREWRFIVMGAGYTTGLTAESVANDPGTGDQVSFIEAGVPAVHIFSGIHTDYHRPSDDIDKVDFPGMVKITMFTKEIVGYLGGREEPLDIKISKAGTPPAQEAPAHPGGSKKRPSLGTMPDFSHPGPGAKVAAVTEGSPAATAGIEEGDIIMAINEIEIADLRGYAAALRSFNAGDTVTVHIKRGEETLAVEATLTER